MRSECEQYRGDFLAGILGGCRRRRKGDRERREIDPSKDGIGRGRVLRTKKRD